MPLQDLTPQLRTRLNRMERAVGLFVTVATVLLLVGLGYYVYKTAQNKGWFAIRARYFTYAKSGAGIHEGDKVRLMGFDVGQITQIKEMPPKWDGSQDNVYIEFEVLNENYGYIWTQGSSVRFVDNLLGGTRQLDISKGTNGYSIYIVYKVRELPPNEIKASPDFQTFRLGEDIYDGSNLVLKAWASVATNWDKIESLGSNSFWVIDRSHTNSSLTAIWNADERHYEPVTKKSKYGLPPDEPLALTDRITAMVAQVQAALPGVLNLTNQIAATLSNTIQLTSNLNVVTFDARASLTNINVITAQLKNPGALGDMLIPTNINAKLATTLDTSDTTLSNLDTNLLTLNLTLAHLADITSNLNAQVQANTNMLSSISTLVVNTDDFVQGLKRFWLFRHTFAKHKTNAPPQYPSDPSVPPRGKRP